MRRLHFCAPMRLTLRVTFNPSAPKSHLAPEAASACEPMPSGPPGSFEKSVSIGSSRWSVECRDARSSVSMSTDHATEVTAT
jgi:hypothetical protein